MWTLGRRISQNIALWREQNIFLCAHFREYDQNHKDPYLNEDSLNYNDQFLKSLHLTVWQNGDDQLRIGNVRTSDRWAAYFHALVWIDAANFIYWFKKICWCKQIVSCSDAEVIDSDGMQSYCVEKYSAQIVQYILLIISISTWQK